MPFVTTRTLKHNSANMFTTVARVQPPCHNRSISTSNQSRLPVTITYTISPPLSCISAKQPGHRTTENILSQKESVTDSAARRAMATAYHLGLELLIHVRHGSEGRRAVLICALTQVRLKGLASREEPKKGILPRCKVTQYEG